MSWILIVTSAPLLPLEFLNRLVARSREADRVRLCCAAVHRFSAVQHTTAEPRRRAGPQLSWKIGSQETCELDFFFIW